jgi:hypothetical protein
MTPEELLKPRYKVINTWPDMGDRRYYQGETLTLIQNVNSNQYCIRRGDATLYDTYFDNYPHLFKKLEWWEERKPEEMPEYLKFGDMIYKVSKPLTIYREWIYVESNKEVPLKQCIPATAADYEAYLQTLTVK